MNFLYFLLFFSNLLCFFLKIIFLFFINNICLFFFNLCILCVIFKIVLFCVILDIELIILDLDLLFRFEVVLFNKIILGFFKSIFFILIFCFLLFER